MATGKLDKDRYYFEYPDKQIVANPLTSASHTWSVLIYLLEKPLDKRRRPSTFNIFETNPEIARRYIKSVVANLLVFGIDKITEYVFKSSTPVEVIMDNLKNKSWNKIKSQHAGAEFDPMVCTFLAQTIYRRTKEHRSNYISDRDLLIQELKRLITTRSSLAFVLSIISSHYCNKVGEFHWYHVLGYIADPQVTNFLEKIHLFRSALTHFDFIYQDRLPRISS